LSRPNWSRNLPPVAPRSTSRPGDAPAKVIGRRFPPPWTVEELEAAFVVRDHNGRPLIHVYYENEQGPRSSPAKPPSRDEAQQIATNVAKLPELLRHDSRSARPFGTFTISNLRHAREVLVLAALGMLCGATIIFALFGGIR
jgi:hypothetical protein